MTMNYATQERSTGLSALEGESEAAILPEKWLADAIHPGIADGEEEFLPVLYRLERELADARVLAGHQQGRPEDLRIRVLYVSRDGRRRVDDSFQARVRETGDGVLVEPRRLLAAIGVDGETTVPREAPVSDSTVQALRELHDCTVQAEDSTEDSA